MNYIAGLDRHHIQFLIKLGRLAIVHCLVWHTHRGTHFFSIYKINYIIYCPQLQFYSDGCFNFEKTDANRNRTSQRKKSLEFDNTQNTSALFGHCCENFSPKSVYLLYTIINNKKSPIAKSNIEKWVADKYRQIRTKKAMIQQ